MREVTGSTDPPESRNGANNHERAESKTAANLATDYPSHEFAATENYLGPGTAIIPLTQERFAFDGGEPFADAWIERYLRFIAGELTDDGVRAFLRARFAYQTFQRLGSAESRRFAWHTVQLACRLSAKSSHAVQGHLIKRDPGRSREVGKGNMSAKHRELLIDFDAIKTRHPLAEYCRQCGIELHRNGSPGRLVGLCPLHTEKTPSFTVFSDNHFKCFGCGAHGDVTDLEQALRGGSRAEAADRLGAQRYQQIASSPKIPKQEPDLIITKENPFGLPYQMSRQEASLCAEAAARLANNTESVEKVAGWRNWKPQTIRGLAVECSLGINSSGRLAFLYGSGCKIRWQENGKRRIIWEFGKPWLWRFSDIIQADNIFIPEGEIDAITLIDAGVEEEPQTLVIALPSASFHIDGWASLFTGKKIIIATDADKAGEEAAEHLSSVLEPVATSIKRLALERIV